RYLSRVDLARLTPRTVTDPDVLRGIVDEVREQGWALVDQELEQGVRSVAAPLHDGTGRVLGAINVSAHAARTTLDQLRRDFLPALSATAMAISRGLGHR